MSRIRRAATAAIVMMVILTGVAHASQVTVYGDPGSDATARAYAVADGPGDDLFIAGVFFGSFLGRVAEDRWDLFVARLDAEGDVVWLATDDAPALDEGEPLFVDGEFRIRIVGETVVVSSSATRNSSSFVFTTSMAGGSPEYRDESTSSHLEQNLTPTSVQGAPGVVAFRPPSGDSAWTVRGRQLDRAPSWNLELGYDIADELQTSAAFDVGRVVVGAFDLGRESFQTPATELVAVSNEGRVLWTTRFNGGARLLGPAPGGLAVNWQGDQHDIDIKDGEILRTVRDTGPTWSLGADGFQYSFEQPVYRYEIQNNGWVRTEQVSSDGTVPYAILVQDDDVVIVGMSNGTVDVSRSTASRTQSANQASVERDTIDPSGQFLDADTSIFERDIEWLAASGITRGCNDAGTRYCPNDFVTRGQMAAFLVRALGYSDDGSGDLFTDDDRSVFETDIDRLATAGVTRGCNDAGTRYCPNDFVTRGQMAAFLVRALGYSDDGSGDLFTDDDRSVFETDIDRLATAGVTRGCNDAGTRYCPNDFVTRGQMAAFLRRALGP